MKTLRLENQVHLQNTMYNFSYRSGASDEYCKGMLVGAVSALMATGYTFEQGLELCAICMPSDSRLVADYNNDTDHSIPELWCKRAYTYFVASHPIRLNR